MPFEVCICCSKLPSALQMGRGRLDAHRACSAPAVAPRSVASSGMAPRHCTVAAAKQVLPRLYIPTKPSCSQHEADLACTCKPQNQACMSMVMHSCTQCTVLCCAPTGPCALQFPAGASARHAMLCAVHRPNQGWITWVCRVGCLIARPGWPDTYKSQG